MTVRLAVLVPTRNRPRLLRSTVRSLQAQRAPIDVWVSDNSTEPVRPLPGTHHLRPASELPVAEHWDWAIRQVLARSDATHLSVHHDRKWFRPGGWTPVTELVASRPEHLVTMPTDSITDAPAPYRFWPAPWTGTTYVVRTARAAELVALGRIAEAVHALPMLASCVAPRPVLESIVDRFGDVCRATGPDLTFLARFLAVHDEYLHLDRSLGVLHAPRHSTSVAVYRRHGAPLTEFRQLLGDRPWLDAAPIPGLDLGSSMLFHEYELVRRRVPGRLPPLDQDACIEELGRGLRWIEDPAERRELAAVLRAHGWRGTVPAPLTRHQPRAAWRDDLKQRWLLRMRLRGSEQAGEWPFASDQAALRHARRHPAAPQAGHDHLAVLDPEPVRW
jgi:hypothetical protein